MAQLGDGTYGVIRVCADRRCGVTLGRGSCVRKCFKYRRDDYARAPGVTRTLAREVVALSATRWSPFVIECHRLSFAPLPELHMPRMDADLKTFMGASSERRLAVMTRIRSATRQLLRGVDHCHRRHIVHRDLKPANLLVSFVLEPDGTQALRLRIADFGMARYLRDVGAADKPARALTMLVQTVWYRAPEVFFGDPRYGKPVDVWSVGCILWELLTSTPLFPGSRYHAISDDRGEADTAGRIFA